VIYPDFLDGKPWDNNNFPPKTDEDKQKLQEFFGGVANVGERVKNVVALAEKLKADGAKFVGTIGFCWVSFQRLFGIRLSFSTFDKPGRKSRYCCCWNWKD
jgi:hypothetical protein